METVNILGFSFLKISLLCYYLPAFSALVKIVLSIAPVFPAMQAINLYSENISQITGRHKLPGSEAHRGKEEKISEVSF